MSSCDRVRELNAIIVGTPGGPPYGEDHTGQLRISIVRFGQELALGEA